MSPSRSFTVCFSLLPQKQSISFMNFIQFKCLRTLLEKETIVEDSLKKRSNRKKRWKATARYFWPGWAMAQRGFKCLLRVNLPQSEDLWKMSVWGIASYKYNSCCDHGILESQNTNTKYLPKSDLLRKRVILHSKIKFCILHGKKINLHFVFCMEKINFVFCILYGKN